MAWIFNWILNKKKISIENQKKLRIVKKHRKKLEWNFKFYEDFSCRKLLNTKLSI